MDRPTSIHRTRTDEIDIRIGLNAEQWETFMEAIDAPPRSHPRMKRLLNEPTILDLCDDAHR